MARRKSAAGTTHVGDALPPPPPMPAKTPEEIAKSREICRKIEELTAIVLQNNLDTAVMLAQMAAQHRGPLVEHFAELGRRYAHTLRQRPVCEPQRPGLRVIRGGAD